MLIIITIGVARGQLQRKGLKKLCTSMHTKTTKERCHCTRIVDLQGAVAIVEQVADDGANQQSQVDALRGGSTKGDDKQKGASQSIVRRTESERSMRQCSSCTDGQECK